MMQNLWCNHLDVILTTMDASGAWKCGVYQASAWFQKQWPSSFLDKQITSKELLPIVIAITIWGSKWENQSVYCHCGNEAVVYMLNLGTSNTVMSLMRCLYFIEAKFNLIISATHLAGTDNGHADALSHNNQASFFLNFPQASPNLPPIPQPLLDLLIHTRPDRTSPTWSRMFNAAFNEPSQGTQQGPRVLATEGTAPSVLKLQQNPIQHQRSSLQFAVHL